MKIIVLLLITCILYGCAGIGSHKYLTLENSKEYVDCGLILGESRAGGIISLSGEGNSKRVNKDGHDILACSKTSGEESLYLFGPLIPFIPMFGMGSDKPPTTSEFVFINYSNKNKSVISSKSEYSWCLSALPQDRGERFTCKNYAKGKVVEIPPNTALSIQKAFEVNSEFSLDISSSEKIIFKFNYNSGMYFIFTG
jgi:hypothetical protein